MSAIASKPGLPPTGTKELTGTVVDIPWHNWTDDSDDGNGADSTDGTVFARLSNGVTAKGPCKPYEIEVGMTYRFLGKHAEADPKYGEQFRFSTFCRAEPATLSGTTRYLVKLCPNIGEKKARRLWEEFHGEAVRTVRTNPEAIAQAGILTLEQAQEAAAALTKFADLEDTRIELFGIFDRRGFPGAIIEKCVDRWGATAGRRIRRDPYCLMTARPKLPGAGFARCDRLFLDNGGRRDRLKRQTLAGWYALRVDGSGDTWRPQGIVRQAINKAVPDDRADPHKAMQLGVRACWLTLHDDGAGQKWVAEAAKAKNERRLADCVKVLMAASPVWSGEPGQFAPGVLSEHQLDRLRTSLSRPVGILAGTPGTGKTFTAAQVVKYLACSFGLDCIAVCAPTGKAAVRCTQAMLGYAIDLEAKTIHRTLKVGRNGHDGGDWGFQHNANNPLPYRFVIVDESSMVDTDLAAALFSACAPGTHVLLIGDTGQLPPVGHGAPLRDLVAAGVPCGELSEIRRNSGLIVHACANIKNGRRFEVSPQFDPAAGLNLKHVAAATGKDAAEALKVILGRFAQSRKFDPVWETQVLVAVNEQTPVSRRALNVALQAQLNPSGQAAKQNPFRVGDKVICLKNQGVPVVQLVIGTDSEDAASYRPLGFQEFVANGEIGKVLAVGPKQAIVKFPMPDRVMKVVMGKPREGGGDDDGPATDEGGEPATVGTGCDFDLAYAVTCHKLQGSEAPCVIVMIDDSPKARRVCSREWAYTAISRAKQLCILIGKMEALEWFSQRTVLEKRKTFLKELLTEGQA